MKLTNGEIYNAKEPLGKLMQEKLPVKAAFALASLARKLGEQIVVIEQVRQGLIKTYGQPDPDNPENMICKPGMDGYPKIMEELGELFSQEVELVLTPVALPTTVSATCDKCNHNMDKALEVEAATLMLLDKFITVA